MVFFAFCKIPSRPLHFRKSSSRSRLSKAPFLSVDALPCYSHMEFIIEIDKNWQTLLFTYRRIHLCRPLVEQSEENFLDFLLPRSLLNHLLLMFRDTVIDKTKFSMEYSNTYSVIVFIDTENDTIFVIYELRYLNNL